MGDARDTRLHGARQDQKTRHGPQFSADNEASSTMTISIVGLNHKSASIEIRERIAFGPDIIAAALRELTHLPDVDEAVILSTCNRTEIYACGDGNEAASLRSWVSRFHRFNQAQLLPHLYSHQDEQAVGHLFAVASGLDSMVLGEPQILGQTKDAYQTACRAGSIGKILGRLFQNSFAVAKQVRTDTAIGNSPVSIAFAAVSLARQIFTDLSEQTVLLVGAGETIELTARHLCQQQVKRIIVANRTLERAHDLAAQFGGYAISLPELNDHLPEADIVITSTASPVPILGKGSIESALKKRRHRPVFMVDIAVPRDIEPQVSELADVYLYTVDDLKEVVEQNMKSRVEASDQAREIIELHCNEFQAWLRSLDAVDTIQAFRGQANRIRDSVLDRALQQLQAGKPPEECLRLLARNLTNKLTHHPSRQLRQASANGEQQLLRAAGELFQLPKRG
jgi:glutamyl-tRNA reductase